MFKTVIQPLKTGCVLTNLGNWLNLLKSGKSKNTSTIILKKKQKKQQQRIQLNASIKLQSHQRKNKTLHKTSVKDPTLTTTLSKTNTVYEIIFADSNFRVFGGKQFGIYILSFIFSWCATYTKIINSGTKTKSVKF